MNRSFSENFTERSENTNHNLQQRVLDMHRQISILKDRLKTEQSMLSEEKTWLNEYSTYMLPNTKGVDKKTMGDSQHLQLPFQQTMSMKFRARSDDIDRHTSASTPTVNVHKEHLQDIQRKCDQELGKLENYIENIQELRNNWMNIKVLKESNNNYGDIERCYYR